MRFFVDISRFVVLAAACFFASQNICDVVRAADDAVPPELDAYLKLKDDSYQWEIVEKRTDSPSQSWLVELTSQTWHGITWKHYMLVVRPEKLKYADSSILFINGGGIGRKPSNNDWILTNMLAAQTNSFVALLFQVPNQPLFDGRVEDALIAETLVRAIAEKDATWPALFPMAKSAIKAMDAIQELAKQECQQDVTKFVVTGASKRGWTTWLTAASGDKRVIAIAPIVIDTLNIQRQMQYQIETWGKWSENIHDYVERDLINVDPEKMDDFLKRLWKMIDPYFYRSRMTLPKLLVHGTNDPYWTVDASQNYWDGLLGTKYLLTLSNVGHDLGDKKLNAFMTVSIFAKNAFEGGTWQDVKWKLSENDAEKYVVTVASELPVVSAKLWTATSSTKEFRSAKWDFVPVEFPKTSEKITQITAEIPKPSEGHVAFYVEIVSEFEGKPFSLTTQVWRK